jgi:CBS-domain-containing membrane protein
MTRLGGGGVLPPRESVTNIALAWFGGFCAIAAVALLTNTVHKPLVLGSFGATCVLVFGFPKVPFSQPRNVIAGHFLSSLIGLVFLYAFGSTWWSMALAAGTAIAVMLLTRTVHPPAGSNPVIVMMSRPEWMFLLTPTLIGAGVILVVALVINNSRADRRYPEYWIGRVSPRNPKPPVNVTSPVQGMPEKIGQGGTP